MAEVGVTIGNDGMGQGYEATRDGAAASSVWYVA